MDAIDCVLLTTEVLGPHYGNTSTSRGRSATNTAYLSDVEVKADEVLEATTQHRQPYSIGSVLISLYIRPLIFIE